MGLTIMPKMTTFTKFDIFMTVTFVSGTGGSSDTIADYYSQLTQSEVVALFKKYQLDFELYGYDPEAFLDIAIADR